MAYGLGSFLGAALAGAGLLALFFRKERILAAAVLAAALAASAVPALALRPSPVRNARLRFSVASSWHHEATE